MIKPPGILVLKACRNSSLQPTALEAGSPRLSSRDSPRFSSRGDQRAHDSIVADDHDEFIRAYHHKLIDALNQESENILRKAVGNGDAVLDSPAKPHACGRDAVLDSPLQTRTSNSTCCPAVDTSIAEGSEAAEESEADTVDATSYNVMVLRKWALISASLTNNLDLVVLLNQERRPSTFELSPLHEEIEIHEDWLPSSKTLVKPRFQSHTSTLSHPMFGAETRNTSWLQYFVVHPDSGRRVVWLLLGGLVLIYDAFTIPLDAVELWPEVPNSFNYACVLYWTLDIAINFLTGFWDIGIVEMRPRMTAKRYANTSLLRDVLIVSTDWSFLLFELGTLISSLRLLRLFRLTRLLRFGKFSPIFFRLASSFTNHPTELMATVGRLLTVIIFLSHYIACAWYGFGIHTGRAFGNSWTLAFDLDDKTPLGRYIFSLLWALAQFTPATNEVNAQNVVEGVFAVIVVLSGLCMFSSFVSGVTGAVNTLQMLSMQRVSSRATVSGFLKRKMVSAAISSKILAYFDDNFGRRRSQQECDVEFLIDLPASLKVQLKENLYFPSLMAYPIFKLTSDVYRDCYVCLCQYAVRDRCYLKNEEIFAETHEGHHMRVLCSGSVVYNCSFVQPNWTYIEKKSYVISEKSFWLQWSHAGSLSCNQDSTLSELDCQAMREQIVQFAGEVYSFFRASALLYAHVASTPGNPITDLHIETSRLEDLAHRALSFCGKVELTTKPAPKTGIFAPYYQGLLGSSLGRLTSIQRIQ